MEQENPIIIDPEKCTRCGICLSGCSGEVLVLEDTLKIIHPERCISCGHCGALCPEEALSSNPDRGKKAFRFIPFNSEWTEAQKLLKSKRSVRLFKTDPLTEEQIRGLIDAAEAAPSSTNRRNREYMVIQGDGKRDALQKEVLKYYKAVARIARPGLLRFLDLFHRGSGGGLVKLRSDLLRLIQDCEGGNDRIFRRAPAVVCIAGPKDTVQSQEDALAAQQYLMLYAKTLGIDSLIIGFAQQAHGRVERFLKLPKGLRVYAVTVLGYGKLKYLRSITYPEPPIRWIQ